jgi:acetoin utilization deacetylase AcuC-like enzyme
MKYYNYSQHDFPLPDNHRFPYNKYKLTAKALVDHQRIVVEARAAKLQELSLLHSQAYLERIFNKGLYPDEERRLGLTWSKDLAVREAYMVGAALDAYDSAQKEGKAAVIGGGTHHAFPYAGEGFCVFNDLCTVHLYAKERDRKHRSLIVDLDVHQGNGNAAIAAGMHDLVTLDLYCRQNFPFQKVTAKYDFPLEAGTKGEIYLQTLKRALKKVTGQFRPHLIMLILGADSHKEDRLGKLELSDDDFSERNRLLKSWLEGRGLPYLLTLGGGYCKTIEKTVELYSKSLMAFE